MNREINQNIKRFFWDVNPDSLDFEKNSEYIIARILEYGDPEAIRWMFKTYGEKKIRGVFMTRRGFSSRTVYFWKSFFNLRKNQILCLKKSYQETQKRLWPY